MSPINLYFASILVGQITANLELSDNLEQDISWQSFCLLLQMFYPIGKNILNKNKDYKDVIKQIFSSRIAEMYLIIESMGDDLRQMIMAKKD